jgi:hypothetical protein
MTETTTSPTGPQLQEAAKLAPIPRQQTARRPPIPQSWTRHRLAWTVLFGYLILLAAIVGTAIALAFLSRPVRDVQQIVVTLGGALSALAGILGFVVGYYFKAEESAAKAAALSETDDVADAPETTG